MQALLEVIFPVFVIIILGYGFTWRGFLNDTQIDGLMKFAQGFAVPLLLFRAISQLDLTQSLEPGLLLSYYTGALSSFFAGTFGARYFFDRDWEDCVVIGFCCLFANSLILGFAITERAYGAQALSNNLMIIAFHAPFCYIIGIISMEIAKAGGKADGIKPRKILVDIFSNVLIIGIIAGFAANIMGLQLPEYIDDTLKMIVSTALPLALFAIGGVLYRFKPEGDSKTILFICAVSLLLHPIIVWSIGKLVSLDQMAFRSAVLTASMAPGVNGYIFANMYGRARRVAASSVLVGTGISALSIWVWLEILV